MRPRYTCDQERIAGSAASSGFDAVVEAGAGETSCAKSFSARSAFPAITEAIARPYSAFGKPGYFARMLSNVAEAALASCRAISRSPCASKRSSSDADAAESDSCLAGAEEMATKDARGRAGR